MINTIPTKVSMPAHIASILDDNRVPPNQTARICQIIGRYNVLISAEQDKVANFAENDFLAFVVREWLEAYPVQLGLAEIVWRVAEERRTDGLDVPDTAELKDLLNELNKLTTTQQLSLIELIEAKFA